MVILEVRRLVKRFGGLLAVNDVSLTVHKGETVGLVGPNGAGKSVLFNCIAGALQPTSGRVLFLGTDTTGWVPERMCRLGLARTFQIPQPFLGLSPLESVCVAAQFGGALAPHESAWSVARSCLEFVEFDRPLKESTKGLNAVDLKRLDLARALASQPQMLLLDELAAGLMTGQLEPLIAILRRIAARGVTIIMVEHVLKTIIDVCDHLIVLDYGQTLADGPTDEVLRDPRVLEAYLGDANLLERAP